jgi:hypothetical protein
MATFTAIVSPTAAHAAQTESNLFILDVSGSTDSVALWKNLRVSVTSKLSQPFGNPKIGSIPYKSPVDVSITSVSKNSQNSPIFPIVTNADSKKMWGAVEQVFPNSTDARLKRINEEHAQIEPIHELLRDKIADTTFKGWKNATQIAKEIGIKHKKRKKFAFGFTVVTEDRESLYHQLATLKEHNI